MTGRKLASGGEIDIITDCLHERLGDNDIAYINTSDLAKSHDIDFGKVNSAVKAIAMGIFDVEGIELVQWGRGFSPGRGERWEIHRIDQ